VKQPLNTPKVVVHHYAAVVGSILPVLLAAACAYCGCACACAGNTSHTTTNPAYCEACRILVCMSAGNTTSQSSSGVSLQYTTQHTQHQADCIVTVLYCNSLTILVH
jgi:hypothetical protein